MTGLYKSVIKREFLEQDTVTIARMLLGMCLVSLCSGIRTSGIIVETEAYLSGDPASHAFLGPNSRNEAMFEGSGIAYIYLIYGLHLCLNVVTGPKGVGEAVLIRALHPVEGIEEMQQRRGIKDEYKLCNGPAKLVQALGITKDLNFHDLTRPPLFIEEDQSRAGYEILTSGRIGIVKAKEDQLRFFLDSPYVSRR
jgi:DNA-3-methyladenine glycosylase